MGLTRFNAVRGSYSLLIGMLIVVGPAALRRESLQILIVSTATASLEERTADRRRTDSA